MSVFQLLLLAGAAYFAWQVYRHVQSLEDDKPKLPSQGAQTGTPANVFSTKSENPTLRDAIEKADEAYAKDDFFNAKIYLERAEMADPSSVEILNKLGYVLHKLGEDGDALKTYKRSLDLNPNDDITHNQIAEVLRSLDRRDEAQEHYKSAVDINDANPMTYFNYGELLLEKDDKEGAKMMFEHALDLDGEYEKAQEALKKLS